MLLFTVDYDSVWHRLCSEYLHIYVRQRGIDKSASKCSGRAVLVVAFVWQTPLVENCNCGRCIAQNEICTMLERPTHATESLRVEGLVPTQGKSSSLLNGGTNQMKRFKLRVSVTSHKSRCPPSKRTREFRGRVLMHALQEITMLRTGCRQSDVVTCLT